MSNTSDIRSKLKDHALFAEFTPLELGELLDLLDQDSLVDCDASELAIAGEGLTDEELQGEVREGCGNARVLSVCVHCGTSPFCSAKGSSSITESGDTALGEYSLASTPSVTIAITSRSSPPCTITSAQNAAHANESRIF